MNGWVWYGIGCVIIDGVKQVMHVRGLLCAAILGLGPASVMAAEDYPRESRAVWLAQAQQGDAQAQYQLGKSLCCGYGAGFETASALRWFCAAAVQGHAGAQYELATQLAIRTTDWRHFGDNSFVSEAYVWYRVSADGGHPLAALYARSLAREMSGGQLKRAERRISQWPDIGCGRY